MAEAEESVRDETIAPPSTAEELRFVARAIFHVLFWAAFVILARRPDAAAGTTLAPDEVMFQDLAPDDQRLVRSLREGVLESEMRRSTANRWPTVAELAAEGVPPFAVDPLDKRGYAWKRLQAGTTTNYVGTPRASSDPTFVAVIIEPPPGTASEQVPPDDTHHRLKTGMMLHVSIWRGPSTSAPAEAVEVLSRDLGWRRIVPRAPPAPSPPPAPTPS